MKISAGGSFEARLLALELETQKTQLSGDREEIATHAALHTAAVAHALQEQARAREEEEDSSFWGEVASDLGTAAKVAGAVAVIATAAETGGGSLALYLAVGGASAVLVDEGAKVAGVDSEVLDGIGTAGSVAMLAGGGIGAFGLDEAPSVLASNSGRVLTAAAGAATVGSGGAKIVSGRHASAAEDARADAYGSMRKSDEEQKQVENVAEHTRHVLATHRAMVTTTIQTMAADQEATAQILAQVGRA